MPFLFFLLMAARRLFSLKGVCLCSYYGGGLRTPFWEFGAFCVFWPFSPDIRAMWPVFRISPSFVIFWLVGQFFLVCLFLPVSRYMGWFRFGGLVPCG